MSCINGIKSIEEIKSFLREDSIIGEGYGEYVVYENNEGIIKEVDERTYRLCYDLFCKHRTTGCGLESLNLASINPTIKATFIPRTLYELFFIKETVEEDLKLGKICPSLLHAYFNRPLESPPNGYAGHCWHHKDFQDFGDDHNEQIRFSAFQLNNIIIKKLDLTDCQNLTLGKIHSLGKEIIEFMHSCHIASNSDRSQKLIERGLCSFGGITSAIVSESKRSDLKPLGIGNNSHKMLVLNAIALECSAIAKDCLILYRGAIFDKDSPLEKDLNGKPRIRSLSYGTGLFAGAMYDGGATAFHYMRSQLEPFAVLVPYSKKDKSPFVIPTTHPLCQLSGHGEKFHARTKAWTKGIREETSVNSSSAHLGKLSKLPPAFKLDVTKEEFVNLFHEYMKNNTVSLK